MTMEENKENVLFREKSLERISSPEALNDYIRVANPGVWLILTAIVILLAGFIIWGCFADLKTTVNGVVVSDGKISTCYVAEERIADDTVQAGMTVTSDGAEYTIIQIDGQSILASDVLSDYEIHLGNFVDGEWVHALSLDPVAPAGAEKAAVTVDSVHPISFILNN